MEMSRIIEIWIQPLHSVVELIQLLDHKYNEWRWLQLQLGILCGIIIAWVLGTRVISRSMFRSALSKVGWQYRSMYISPFSFAVVITDVTACAHSCPILRSILLSVLPSINVKAASSSTLKVRQIVFRPSIIFVWRRVPWSKSEGEEVGTETPTSASIATPPEAAPSQIRTFPLPAPQVIIELRDVCIEMEKLYMAPLFDFDDMAAVARRLPSALLATQAFVGERGKQQPPTFFEENIALLESHRADSVTYLLEQWLQQQSTKKDSKFFTIQRLVQMSLRLILSSFSLHVRNFSCRVYGPGVETIRSVREEEKNPSDTLIALAAIPKNLCATTEFGFQAMEFSFHGYNYELLITMNQFYIQVGIPKSIPVHPMPWARKQKEAFTNANNSSHNDGRTWSYVISPNDGLVNISGVLDWLIGDTWDTKLLAVTCSFLESCFILDPEHVHTLFLHFDDYLDASSPFNEWRQWYSQHIKIKSTSLDQLFQEYRNCFFEQQSLEHRNFISNPEKNTTLPQPKCGAGDGGVSDKSMLKALERRMTFEQIMEQRRQVMGMLWDMPRNNKELKEYVSLNRSDNSLPPAHYSSKKESKSDAQVKKYWFDVLIGLVEQKASFSAALVTFSIVLPSFKVVLVKINDKTHHQKEVCTQGIVFIDLCSKLQLRNPSLSYTPRSDFLVGQKPKCFMKLDGSIQQVLCIVEDEDTFASLPHVVEPHAAKLPFGLLFKHPAAEPFKESFNWSFFLTSTVEATQPYLNATLDLSDVLLTYIPQLVEDSLNTFLAASDVPYWDASVESIDDVSITTEGSLESHTDIPHRDSQIEETIESCEAISTFDDLEQSYLLMGGSNMDVSLTFINVSFVIFMDGSSLNGNALELNIQHADLTVLSSPDSEDLSLTADRLSATACRLVPSRAFSYGVQIGHMPIKKALLIKHLLLQYHGTGSSNEKQTENSTQAAKKVQFAQVENTSKSSQERTTDTVKMRINIILQKILFNVSPTVMLVLSGFYKSLPKRAAPAEANVESAIMNSATANVENKEMKFDLDQLREKYPLIFEKTQMSREDLKHVMSEMLVKSRSDVPESKKTNSLTSREFQRELETLCKSIDDNFQDDSVDAVALMSFIQQLQWNEGLKFDEPMNRTAISLKHLLGIIHFEDLREYTSTAEVYRITGCKEKQNYPPVINWRQGKGTERFWHLYCSETGCSRTSLNGQDIMQVQIKLVRALCNYEFAKYCWKVLVRPNLQEMSINSGRSNHSRRKLLNFKIPVTDWLLDRNTSYAARNDSFQDKMQRWMIFPSNGDKKTSASLLIPYDIGLLIEVKEIVCTFGNGTTGSTPLLSSRISNFNFSALLLLYRSLLTGFSCDFDTESAESHQNIALVRKDDSHVKNRPFNPQEGAQAQVHCEVTVEASYLNAKHNIMDILMEHFFVFVDGSYQTNKASFNSMFRLLTSNSGRPSRDIKQKEGNERTSSSLRINCPQYLGLNASPALLGCVPERYEQINKKRLEENLRSMWKSFTGDVSSELDNVALKGMINKHFKSMSWKRLDEEIDDLASELSKCDVNRNGFVSLEEAKLSLSKSRRASLFALPGEARLKNKTGVELTFCSTAAYEKLGDAALETLQAGDLKVINLSGVFSLPSTAQQKAQISHFSLLIPKFNCIHNIPVANFQVFMVPLTPSVSNATFIANERKSRREARSVSGFASLLTFHAVSDIIDTVTVQVRSCVTVEALTPIDFRIVRVSANVAFNQLDLTSMKRLVNYMEVLGDGGIIVHEILHVPKKKQLPIPLNILTSPFLHMLYFRDIDDVQRQWRAGILLHYDFLSNTRNRAEISRYHAKAGISVQFDRLTCLQNQSLEEKETVMTKYTAVDTVIRVFPTFVVRNALPFGLAFKCWQSAVEVGKPRLGKSVKWFPEELSAGGSIGSDEHGLLPEKNTTVRRHSLADTTGLDFYDFGCIEEGGSANFNGVDIGKKLFLQITQALNAYRSKFSVTRHLFPLKAKPELYWTSPIQLDLDLLQAGGNVSGRASLPEIIAQLGDEVDVSLKVEVESSTICLTLYSAFWISNKSLMKMEYKFSGNEAIILDSGVGGLPILVSCKEKESSLDTLLAKKREISVRPVERPTEVTKSVWWDNVNGDLTFMDPLLRRGTTSQVHWCEPMLLDKAGTKNEINCGGVLLGSSISTMTGIFHRSNLITFQPRYIVQNQLRHSLLIVPLEGPQNQIKDMLKNIHGHVAKDSSLDLFTLGPGESTIVYRFMDVAMFSQISRSRYICFHSHGLKRRHRWHLIVVDSSDPQFFVERSLHTAAVIDIIRVEPHEIDACSVIKMAHCEIPPFRLENRSNEHFIRFSQDGEDTLQELAPMTWCGYYWDNPVGILKLKVAAASPKDNGGQFITATPNEPNRRSQFRYYQFKNVGKMKDLPCSDQSDVSLSVSLRMIGGSRVLSFSDSSWHFDQNEFGCLRRGGNWKNVLIEVSIAGFVFSLSDYYPREVLCITVKSLLVRKQTGQVDTNVRISLVQIDTMQGSARYPIMLAPAKNVDFIVRPSLQQDIDQRKHETVEPFQLTPNTLNNFDLSPPLRTYWDDQKEQQIPIFEANISYLPQPSVLWIPEVAITFCPVKIQVDTKYVLRIVNLLYNNLFLNFFPELDDDHHLKDVSDLLEHLNSHLQIPQLPKEYLSKSYFERVRVNETFIDIDLDLKPDDSVFDAYYDEEDSTISLTSLGRVTKSAISASLLSWVNIASTAFSKISPKFKFSGFVRDDCYASVIELLSSIINFYTESLVKQSYKVLFTAHRLGDPTQLYEDIRTGCYELFVISRESGIGKGTESFVRNTIGGVFDFLGRLSGSTAELLEELVLRDALTNRNALFSTRPPEHFAEGFMQGSLFFTLSVTQGIIVLVKDPYKGIKARSPRKATMGLIRGASGLVASPLIGALGFFSKSFDGVKATTHLLEKKVVESRCRPKRVSSWGGSLGSIGIDYLKAIGIRIHVVRFQQKTKDVFSAVAVSGAISRSSNKSTDSKSKKSEAGNENEVVAARNPRFLLLVRQSKGNFCLPSKPATPIAVKQSSQGGTLMTRYDVLFEETLVLRTQDMQFSDQITLELWKSNTYYSHTRKKKPIATCSFTLQEAFISLLLLRRSLLDQILLQSTQLSNLRPEIVTGKDILLPHLASHEKKSQVSQEEKRKEDFYSSGYCVGICNRVTLTHIAMPPIQEYSLKKLRPGKRNDASSSSNIVKDIENELDYVESQYANIIQSLDEGSFSDSTTTSNSSDLFGGNSEVETTKQPTKAERYRNEREQLYGQVYVSFIPTSW